MGAEQGVSMGQAYSKAAIAADGVPIPASANAVLISTDSKESGLWLWQGETPSQPSPPQPKSRAQQIPVQIGENFYGPRALYTALQMKACDYVMPDFMRIGGVTGWQRAAAIAAAAGIPISTQSLSRGSRARHAGQRNGALARVAGLGQPDLAAAL